MTPSSEDFYPSATGCAGNHALSARRMDILWAMLKGLFAMLMKRFRPLCADLLVSVTPFAPC